MREKYNFLKAQKTNHSIRTMCAIFSVNRSAYYRWLCQPTSERTRKDEVLLVHIRALHAKNRGAYGAIRITKALREEGFFVGHNRVARLMRNDGLHGLPYRPKRFRSQTRANQCVYENHLDRNFNPDTPNEVWVGDITYIWTSEGWLYLSVLIDLFGRKVISVEGASHMRSSLIEDCLSRAILLRGPNDGLMHHSDRGSQYTSRSYQLMLENHGFRCSMSRVGNCWDNAVVESFFGRMKTECINRQKWRTRSEALAAVQDYINNFYNPIRFHSSNQGMSPNQKEYNFYQQQKQNTNYKMVS